MLYVQVTFPEAKVEVKRRNLSVTSAGKTRNYPFRKEMVASSLIPVNRKDTLVVSLEDVSADGTKEKIGQDVSFTVGQCDVVCKHGNVGIGIASEASLKAKEKKAEFKRLTARAAKAQAKSEVKPESKPPEPKAAEEKK